jgi:hypothetical protein
MAKKIGTMTNEERLQKTIRLQKTDKILSVPAVMQFAATYAGISQKDFLESVKAEKAYEKTFNELGGWDVIMPISGIGPSPFALKTLLPGRDLPDDTPQQIVEEEVMVPDDYDFVIQYGFDALRKRLLKRTNPEQAAREEGGRLTPEQNRQYKAKTEKWAARGIATLFGASAGSHPFEYFSFHRSLAKFSMDVRRMPEKVNAAIEACIPALIANAKEIVKATGCRRAAFANTRGSSTFINSKTFEQLVLPSWLELTNALVDDDIDVIFHCDTNWIRFLPYFKEFPRARCVLQLDGATDIFKAKEILRDHMAIQGDVPATILTLGTPEQVTDYCKKLIEVVGEGGGFILGTGCSLPFDAKVENFRAMIKAGNELTWY